MVQDLLLWCTTEFGYLRLSDGFVQCSSIMPQKRNPVALEHARAIASKAVGQATAILLAVHNTPFGDIVDTEDDLQPLVSTMFRDARPGGPSGRRGDERRAFDTRADGRARGRRTGSPSPSSPTRWRATTACRSRPATPSRRVWSSRRRHAGRRPLSAVLRDVSLEVLGRSVEMDDDALARVLSPRHFVEVRTTPGGPAPSETARAIAASRLRLAEDDGWLKARIESLRGAERELDGGCRALEVVCELQLPADAGQPSR